MKKTKRFMLLAFVIMISMMSCNNEELFVEPTQEEVVDDQDNVEVPEDEVEDETEVDASLPCDFNLNTIEPNSTIIINCIMDLGGNTINLPEGVTFLYEGGEIINGTLNFSGNTIISGELLNSSITLIGSSPQLKDPTFNFDPKRWGIVEGKVSDDIALNNRTVIREVMRLVKELGVSTFKLDAIDAYFKIDEPFKTEAHGAIRIPSDFNLIMTDNTFLRVQPNSHYRSSLLTVFEESNVTISGGNLFGDRDTHDYSAGGTQEWGYVILLRAASNVIIKDVKMFDAGGDGLHIDSMRFAWESNYNPSYNILVSNCIIDKSRRNNVSIVDGHDIIVENCTFLNAGVDTNLSKGTAPKYAVDIEPIIGANENMPQQRVDRVIIRNNIESGSIGGAFVAFEGDDITVSGNTFVNRVAYNYASNVKIVNNPSLGEIIAGAKDDWGRYRNKGNIISGNTITNGAIGISARNQDIQIFDNKIIDCTTGIQLDGLKNSNIYNNNITSNKTNSDGINALDYVDGVVIDNNNLEVKRHSLLFDTVNHSPGEENFTVTFKNNTITSDYFSLVVFTNGLIFTNNNLFHGLRLTGSTNVLFQSNIFKAGRYFNINITNNDSDNITIIDNTIENTDIGGQGNGIYSIDLTSSSNKNINISNNTFIHKGYNSGIYITGINGLKVENNTGTTENNRPLIYYRGDNSTFTNNTGDIIGNNNIIN